MIMGAAALSIALCYPVQAEHKTKEEIRLQDEVKTMKLEDKAMKDEDKAIAKEETEMKQLDLKLIALEKESVKNGEQRIKIDEQRLVNSRALIAKHENELRAANISDKSREHHEQACKAQVKRSERLEQRITREKNELISDKEKLENDEKLSKLVQN